MMHRMDYNLRTKVVVNFGKGSCVPLKLRVRRNKDIDYYHIIGRELGYGTTPKQSEEEFFFFIRYDQSLDTSSWESDVSIGDAFQKVLSIIMTSAT